MMQTMKCLLLCVLCLAALQRSLAAQEAPKIIEGPGSTLSQAPRPAVGHARKLPYGLELMAHFELLPLLRDTKCVQDSSYDRSGGNGDAGHFFRKEGNKAVLSDIRGPGCIYRFWSANAAGHLKMFFDGEEKPRIDCPMQDLFLGKVKPFVAPLVGHKSGGWFCFFPIPFEKSCRIEVTDPGSMYYHVQYQLFPDKTPVTTFTTELSKADQAALAIVKQQWEHLGSDPKEVLFPIDRFPDTEYAWSTELQPGETKQSDPLKFTGEIQAITLNLPTADRYSLRQVVLRAYWDGAKDPAIEAPIGDFFGAGFGDQRFQALPLAMSDSNYACYFPKIGRA